MYILDCLFVGVGLESDVTVPIIALEVLERVTLNIFGIFVKERI